MSLSDPQVVGLAFVLAIIGFYVSRVIFIFIAASIKLIAIVGICFFLYNKYSPELPQGLGRIIGSKIQESSNLQSFVSTQIKYLLSQYNFDVNIAKKQSKDVIKVAKHNIHP
ncbi:MAG: hypothetical protein KBC84_03150 [Proteobacteria bacterium]|nr:hypothetical protein [Pseudomonadota bacterium]